MKMRKICAVLLCAVMLMTVFTACETKLDPEKLETKAAMKLLEEPYVLTMKMSYASDNEELQEVYDQLSGVETKIYMDGTDFTMSMDLMGQSVSYTCVDKVLYLEMMGMKLKGALTDEQIKDMTADMAGSSFTGMRSAGFASCTVTEEDDGSVVISCLGFDDEASDLLDSLMGEMGSEEGAEVSVDTEKVSYIAVIDPEGAYSELAVKVPMVMNIAEYGDVSMEIAVEMTFDYEGGIEITAPADADQYTDMDMSEVVG